MKRAPKRKEEVDATYLHVRISKAIKAKLELAAAREGLDLSNYARNTMIRRARELGIEI